MELRNKNLTDQIVSDFDPDTLMQAKQLKVRRRIYAVLLALTTCLLAGLMLFTVSINGISPIEWALFACFFITLPWTVIGFWNAVIGFCLMRFTKKPAEHVFPALAKLDRNAASASKTAIAMCIRNEEVAQVRRNIEAVMTGLERNNKTNGFHVFLLSDSTDVDIIAEEKAVFDELRLTWLDKMPVTYRLRDNNHGFKAGNIRDFCEKWGANFNYMLVLDADSVMAPEAIDRLVLTLDQNPNVGLVQSLVVGLPATAGFTRIFQFGMRLGMRSYTLGSAWWQGDCGPYWGHNALIRLKPFIDHCDLPEIEGKGPLCGTILSHDQVEAVLMRRAGFECRVIAEEGGSWEDNPPDLVEFIRRDLRWCHGNMQYLHLLQLPNLQPISRVQLFLAILMFIGSPAWIAFIVFATINLLSYDKVFEGFEAGSGYALFATIMLMIFAPKLVTIVDVLMHKSLRRGFGGTVRVLFSATTEILFSMLIAPIMAIATTMFLIQLPFGRAKSWAAQRRSSAALPVSLFAKRLIPQSLFGLAGIATLIGSGLVSVIGFAVSLPVFFGPLVAVPFGWATSHPVFGAFATKTRLWTLPEETMPEQTILDLKLDALERQVNGFVSIEDSLIESAKEMTEVPKSSGKAAAA